LNRYDKYCELLLKWNKIHNLTGAKNKAEVEKNIQDSLYPKDLLREAKNIVDIGSGAGFPGLLLAIAYPEKNFTLTEPIKKKASFLKTAARALELSNVSVESKRIEELDCVFDCVVSRAVAPTKTLLKLCQNVVTPQTTYLFYKGEEVYSEIEGLDANCELLCNEKRIYLYMKEYNG
jgi:16S rRNA (guanine527-N7)-methyltransferase